MDREDARTVSQIELVLGREAIRYTYRARDPDGLGYLDPVTIEQALS